MPEYLLKEEDITAVSQVPTGESMPAQVGMEALDAGLAGQAGEDQLQRIRAQRLSVKG